jgi:hypothetical protein
VSEDCVGVRAASAASEQSARQEQDGLENDERSQNRDAHGRPLYKQSRILCGGTGLHVLGSWLDPGRRYVYLAIDKLQGLTEKAVARTDIA